MKFLLLLPIFCFSCKNEIHVTGIILDNVSKQPLKNVFIKTICDGDESGLQFVQTKSEKNGRFDMKFSSASINSDTIALELSKEGYLTNIYNCCQDRLYDIFL